MKFLLLLLLAPSLPAALQTTHVTQRTDVANGKSFGAVGAYERLIGKAYFTVDPRVPANRIITDLRHAQVNVEGLVEFSADFHVMKPRDPSKGNGTILFEVSNRGRRGLLGMYSYGGNDNELGDAYLLEQGYTLAWVAWQFDVQGADLLRMTVPVAKGVEGLVRAEAVVTEPITTFDVGDRGHLPYPAADPNDAGCKMFVRDYADGPRTEVARGQWRFATPTTVSLDGGFQAGKRYEVIYKSREPGIAGLGLAGMRDFISFLKYGGGDATAVLGDQNRVLKRAIAFGSSQSGRYLREFLYQGFNGDEQGRKVFDGMIPHIAGGGRGSFTHRFAQPSRLAPYYTTDIFPFRDVLDTDPETGIRDGLLRIAGATNTVPRIFFTNTSNEYWRISASLTHTSLDGKADAAIAPTTRIYHLSGTQHGAGQWPPARDKTLRYRSNANDYRPIMRALLAAMNQWITKGTEPPPSRYPSVPQSVPPADIRFGKIPGFDVPNRIWQARRLDFGPDFRTSGVIAFEPPLEAGKAFAVRLPQVDDDGNEVTGIRNPVVAVPLGSYFGWNLMKSSNGPVREMAGLTGSYIPFAKTRADREKSGDSRPSIEERYPSRAEYLNRVAAAARKLVAERYLLAADLDRIVRRAEAEWDTLTK